MEHVLYGDIRLRKALKQSGYLKSTRTGNDEFIPQYQMNLKHHTRLFVLGMSFAFLLPGVASAGYDEGVTAYKNNDYATALQEFRQLAIQGNAAAQYNVGMMYGNGQGVLKDYKEAVKWYRLAAAQGNADAQYDLGIAYDNGQGVSRDFKEAEKWYRLAAAQGEAGAQYNLGVTYDTGAVGVPRDFKEAEKWYRLAAAQGDARAQYNLGVKYTKGQGVTQDFKEAVKWHRLAAEQGHAQAQSNLGYMYENGMGVVSNLVVAYALYSLSASSMDSAARKNPKGLLEQAQTREILATKRKNIMDLSMRMEAGETNAARDLTRELAKPGNLLKALDNYVKARGQIPR